MNNVQGQIYEHIDNLNMITLPPSAQFLQWHNHTKDMGLKPHKTVLLEPRVPGLKWQRFGLKIVLILRSLPTA